MGKSSKRTADDVPAAAPASDAAPMQVDTPAPVDTPSKAKKAKKDKPAEEADAPEAGADTLSLIARPLAQKKTSKHVLKLVKKASKARHLKRGVKEVVKSIRKGEKGIVVLAADISPIDILTHIPLLAEEAGCPYIWVSSKEALGLASSTKRPTSCVMVAKAALKRKLKEGETDKDADKEKEKEFQEEYVEVETEVKALEAITY